MRIAPKTVEGIQQICEDIREEWKSLARKRFAALREVEDSFFATPEGHRFLVVHYWRQDMIMTQEISAIEGHDAANAFYAQLAEEWSALNAKLAASVVAVSEAFGASRDGQRLRYLGSLRDVMEAGKVMEALQEVIRCEGYADESYVKVREACDRMPPDLQRRIKAVWP